MKAIDEYIAFTVFRNKNHLEGVVTLIEILILSSNLQ